VPQHNRCACGKKCLRYACWRCQALDRHRSTRRTSRVQGETTAAMETPGRAERLATYEARAAEKRALFDTEA
jgi:hypothetical protein